MESERTGEIGQGEIGWGVLGCGWVARDYGVPAIREAAGSRLVALCDRDAEALAAVASDAGTADLVRTADLDVFLADDAVEAVYVATPNDSHPALVAACAEAGKAVLCEKPMARTLAEAEAMVETVKAAGVPYATAFDQRFHPAHVRLRDLVAAGALGTVTAVRIHYACWTPPDWAPDDAHPHTNWRVDPEVAGGGALIDLAPHGLDLTQMLLGERLTDVAAFLQRRVFDYPVDDGATLMARSASGVLLSHAVAYNCPDAFPRRHLEVIGTEGHARAVNTMGQTPGGTLTLTTPDGSAQPVAFDAARSPFTAQVEAFTEAVRTDAAFPFSPDLDLHTMRLIEQATSATPRHA